MTELALSPKEEAFLAELDRYVNQWVVIVNYDTDDQIIVASGRSIKDARREAELKGFTEFTFFKVPSPESLFVPLQV